MTESTACKPPLDSLRASTRAGFTLVEMSMVLVIIGLVVGGIVSFTTMRETFQARKLMTQMENYQAAVNAFKLKYSCIPGDCARASQFGLGTSGNGNSFLAKSANPASGGCLAGDSGGGCATTTETTPWGAYVVYPIWGEIQQFWVHLAAAGFTADKVSPLLSSSTSISLDDHFPRDAIGKTNLIAFMWNSKLYIRTGFTPPVSGASDAATMGSSSTAPALNSAQMYYIHHKIDPGVQIETSMSGHYPVVMRSGHRVIPVSICTFPQCTNGYKTNVYVPAGYPTPVAWGHQYCAVQDSAGMPYRYNVERAAGCNFLWRLDY